MEKIQFPKLNGENYSSWKFSTELLLIRENLWKFVTQARPADQAATTADPGNAAELEDWDYGDQRARATIGLLMESNQHGLIKQTMTAREAWKKLGDHFEKPTLTSKVSLLRNLITKRYSEGEDMEKHVVGMEEIFERLSLADLKLDEKLQVAIVLSSLPKSFNTLTTALESRADDELTLELVKRKLIDEVTKIGSYGNETGLRAGSGKKPLTCHYCQKPGHKQRECRKLASDREEENRNDQENRKTRKTSSRAKAVREDRSEATFMARGAVEAAAWVVDSGATSHMCAEMDFFVDLDENVNEHVVLADGKTTVARGKGTCRIGCCDLEGKNLTVNLTDTLYVPNLESNLISVRKLVEKKGTVIFDAKGCTILKDERVAANAVVSGGLYVLKNAHRATKVEEKRHTANCQHTWHRRMGHRDNEALQDLKRKSLATGLQIEDCGLRIQCECCLEGKFARLPFPKEAKKKSKRPLDLVHVDVCGPMKNVTQGGCRYYLTVIDDYSRYTTVYFLREKSDAEDKLKDFVMEMKTTFGRPPKIIRSDNGGEFKNRAMEDFCRREGIRQQFTTPYTPQQNGVAERKNRSLNEMAKCMLLDADLPLRYWAEAVNTANYLQNRLPTTALQVTPYEAWWDEKPDVSHLQIFGTKAFVWVPKQNRSKFDSKAVKMTFVGYSSQQKAYRFLDLMTGTIVNSRDARFLTMGNTGQDEASENGSIIECSIGEHAFPKTNNFPIVAGDVHGEQPEIEEESDSDEEDDQNETIDPYVDCDVTLTDGNDENERPPNAPIEPVAPRTSSRTTKGVPPQRYGETGQIAIQQAAEPRTVAEALGGPEREQWKKAMDEEFASLQENKTWEIVQLPSNRKPVGCRWIFKKKLDEHGNVARYKARLVAKGFSQKFGTDYDEVYAPVAKHTTFRALLAVAARRMMDVKHIDIKTAYLYGEISEEIFMQQPPGYETGNRSEVCSLRRSLYGLKQAGRVWNRTITEVLMQLGYKPTEADNCLFVRNVDGELSFILLYVDDMLIVSFGDDEYRRVCSFLGKKFKISCLGNVKNYLGIQVERNVNGDFLLSQEGYINRIVARFSMEQAKPSPIPMDPGYPNITQKEEKMPNSEKYQSLVGALLYVAVCTRPDLAITASILGRRVSKPTETDWSEAKRALRYLKGTANLRLKLGGEGNLEGYADADWAGDRSDRKSNSGFLFKLGGGPIAWTSRKQSCVTLSSTEAEYVALAEATKELLWLIKLMRGLGEEVHYPVLIHEDNQSCISMLQNEGDTRRTKHIDTRFNLVRDLKKSGVLCVRYCPTESMEADALTKPLPRVKLERLRSSIGRQQIVIEEEC